MSGKKIDLESWKRKELFKGFIQMAAPCYGMNVRMDVTNLVKYCKKTNQSFFINLMYLCIEEMCKVEEFRMRIIAWEPWIFDIINCSFTILNNFGYFVNRSADFSDYPSFYENVNRVIGAAKNETNINPEKFDFDRADFFYFSSIPWIDYQSITQPLITQPLPLNNPTGDSIPRVSWGKYVEQDEKYFMTMHMTVNHSLIDGKPLSDAFNNIQEALHHLRF